MPKEVDVKQRRSEFVGAAWRVIRKDGLPAATLRRVAAEARCTTGALTHYFSNREALLVHALRAAHFTAGARMIEAARAVKGDLKRLETIVLEALPLDDARMQEWKTHLTFWGEACDNRKLRDENARRFREWGELLDRYLAPIVPTRDALRREAVLLMALIDGLALRIVLQSGRGDRIHAPSAEIVTAVRFHLQSLRARYARVKRS
jgi:TetR/AcrR family transcriptional regulator, transcriptional repressor of bet genes